MKLSLKKEPRVLEGDLRVVVGKDGFHSTRIFVGDVELKLPVFSVAFGEIAPGSELATVRLGVYLRSMDAST